MDGEAAEMPNVNISAWLKEKCFFFQVIVFYFKLKHARCENSTKNSKTCGNQIKTATDNLVICLFAKTTKQFGK